MIWDAVHAGFGYFQREAGYTRTGSHGTRVHGRETGQWHEADLAVAHWLQHTSRDGDMQLHVHSQIAHVAKTSHRREMAGAGLTGVQRAHRRGRRDRLPAPRRSPHRPVRPGVDRPRRRPRLRDQGHQRADDAPVLLPPRIHHRRPARPRRAVRAAVRPRAVPARARAARAGVELQDAQPQARRAGCRAGARGLGRQARADPRREPGLSRAVSVARRNRPRRRARARRTSQAPPKGRAGARGTKGGRAGPAGKEHLDPRRRDQVPGPRPAQDRPGPGRSRRAARRPGRPGAALGVRTGHLPGSTRAGRSPAQLAARRRAQHLPAARRHPVRHARAAGHGRTHAHPSPRARRAAPDPRASRARARRRPRAARRRAGRPRGRRAGHAHADRAAHRPGRRGAVGPDRRHPRVRDQRPGRAPARHAC